MTSLPPARTFSSWNGPTAPTNSFPMTRCGSTSDYALDEFAAPCEVIPDEDGGVPARHTITIEDAPERFSDLLQKLEAVAA